MSIKNKLIESEKIHHKEFYKLKKEQRLNLISEYRKLVRINTVFDCGYFEMILSMIERYFPAYSYEKIHDENDDVNHTYYELQSIAENYDFTDEEFYFTLTGEEYIKEKK